MLLRKLVLALAVTGYANLALSADETTQESQVIAIQQSTIHAQQAEINGLKDRLAALEALLTKSTTELKNDINAVANSAANAQTRLAKAETVTNKFTVSGNDLAVPGGFSAQNLSSVKGISSSNFVVWESGAIWSNSGAIFGGSVIISSLSVNNGCTGCR